MTWIRDAVWAGGEFLYPRSCVLCGFEIPKSSSLEICSTCRFTLLDLGRWKCEVCSGVVGPNLDTTHGCVNCSRRSFSFQTVTSLGPYVEPLRGAVVHAKSSSDWVQAVTLCDLLWETEQRRLKAFSAEVILPIPHHWSDRLFSRQMPADVIADRFGKHLKIPVEHHLLRKTRKTPKQHAQPTETARRKNLRNAFSIDLRAELSGANVLLVDDVFTSGTTCQRATMELKRAGVKRVDVLVLARHVSQSEFVGSRHSSASVTEASSLSTQEKMS